MLSNEVHTVMDVTGKLIKSGYEFSKHEEVFTNLHSILESASSYQDLVNVTYIFNPERPSGMPPSLKSVLLCLRTWAIYRDETRLNRLEATIKCLSS